MRIGDACAISGDYLHGGTQKVERTVSGTRGVDEGWQSSGVWTAARYGVGGATAGIVPSHPVGNFMAQGRRHICLPTVVFQTFRSEEHTSELQSLMRISYAVFCLKKKN